jgi:hypothetical protein
MFHKPRNARSKQFKLLAPKLNRWDDYSDLYLLLYHIPCYLFVEEIRFELLVNFQYFHYHFEVFLELNIGYFQMQVLEKLVIWIFCGGSNCIQDPLFIMIILLLIINNIYNGESLSQFYCLLIYLVLVIFIFLHLTHVHKYYLTLYIKAYSNDFMRVEIEVYFVVGISYSKYERISLIF